MESARGVPRGWPVLSRAEEKLVRGLMHRKTRQREGLFLIEGVRAVEELLAAGFAPRLALVASSLEDTPRGAVLLAQLEAVGAARPVAERRLAALAATDTPQGVVAVAEIPRCELAGLRPDERATVLMLDGVQDPGNVGTLIRTAGAFGVLAAVTLPGTVEPWNPKAVRSAAGASFRVPIVPTGLDEVLEWLRARGFVVFAADAGGTRFDAVEPARRVALAVGNEGAGLSPRVRRAADALLAVPIRGRVESLNVAAAAAILLHHLTLGQ